MKNDRSGRKKVIGPLPAGMVTGVGVNAIPFGDPTNGKLMSDGNLSYNDPSNRLSVDSIAIKDSSLAKTAPAISGGVLELDLTTGNVFVVSLNANITTFRVRGCAPSGKTSCFVLVLVGDGTARTITWGSGVTWINNGGSAPTPTSTLNKRDKYTLFSYDGGTEWFITTDAQNY